MLFYFPGLFSIVCDSILSLVKYSLFGNNDDTLSLVVSINLLLEKTSDSVNKVDVAELFFAYLCISLTKKVERKGKNTLKIANNSVFAINCSSNTKLISLV